MNINQELIVFSADAMMEYFSGLPINGSINIAQNKKFEESKDEESDIFLEAAFENKMILDKKLSFKKDKLYRIIFPKSLSNFESFNFVAFMKGLIDDRGTTFSVYENTLNSILVRFKEDANVHTLVVWVE